MKNELHMNTRFFIGLLAFFLNLGQNARAQGPTITLDSTVLTEREVAIGVQVPWEILWGPDQFIWATERRGRVLRINPATGNITTILNIQTLVESGGEPGLLGMVLHPDFTDTPLVYLVYTYPGGATGIAEKVVSYQWNGSTLANPVTLIDTIRGGGIHNGSRLLISPDKKLFVTTGEIGSGSLSQNMASINGKLLRMNLDGSIPDDNPVPGSYIYSFGHRNAQGLAYGPGGKLYSSEHGAQQSDEFNLIEANRNYGWPNVQGLCNTNSEMTFCANNNVKEPLREFSPCVAVNGIEYYNHDAIPEWKGKMLMAVLGGFVYKPRLSVLEFNADGTQVVGEKQYFADFGRLRDVCINPNNGAVYFATNGPDYPGAGPNRIIEYRNLSFTPSSTSEVKPEDQFIDVYPMPVAQGQELTIAFSPSFIGSQYDLIGFDGVKMATAKITSGLVRVGTENLPKASYYITATNAQGTITKKVIIH
jgi:aldose sugar dehydrogenase